MWDVLKEKETEVRHGLDYYHAVLHMKVRSAYTVKWKKSRHIWGEKIYSSCRFGLRV